MGDDHILACDVGRTRMRVAVVETGGAVVSKEIIPTPKQDSGALMRSMRSVAGKAGQSIRGAVLGLPGVTYRWPRDRRILGLRPSNELAEVVRDRHGANLPASAQ